MLLSNTIIAWDTNEEMFLDIDGNHHDCMEDDHVFSFAHNMFSEYTGPHKFFLQNPHVNAEFICILLYDKENDELDWGNVIWDGSTETIDELDKFLNSLFTESNGKDFAFTTSSSSTINLSYYVSH